jgi:hypothetical protein
MLSYRPRPAFKFFMTRNCSASKSIIGGHLANLSKNDAETHDEYDDYIEMHRRNIIMDYRKKVQ